MNSSAHDVQGCQAASRGRPGCRSAAPFKGGGLDGPAVRYLASTREVIRNHLSRWTESRLNPSDPGGSNQRTPDLHSRRIAQRAQTIRRKRRRAAFGIAVLLLLLTGVLVVTLPGKGRTSAVPHHPSTPKAPAPTQAPDTLEAGIEGWQMGTPVSREAVVATGDRLTVLGGITAAGASLAQVSSIDPLTGAVTSSGSLATAVHDAAAATIGRTIFVLGGGSPDTVSTVQSIPVPPPPHSRR